MNIINYLVDYSTEFISSGGPLFGFFIVFLECFIPALPLSVFVALNVNAFGFFIGVTLSWIATFIGSYLCYLLFYFLEEKYVRKLLRQKTIKKIQNSIDRFKKIKLFQLVFIITLPFTPSFFINILSGLSRIPKEKYFIALMIGKVFSVMLFCASNHKGYAFNLEFDIPSCGGFWGYVGKSIIGGYNDIRTIIYILVSLLLAYILSKTVGKKMNIE